MKKFLNVVMGLFVAVMLCSNVKADDPADGNLPCPEYCLDNYNSLIELALQIYMNKMSNCNHDTWCEMSAYLELLQDLAEIDDWYNGCCQGVGN